MDSRTKHQTIDVYCAIHPRKLVAPQRCKGAKFSYQKK